MEDNNEFNIYYQYNSQKEINNPELIGDTYFLIEYQRNSGDNLNFTKVKKLLKGDGVNFETIKQILIEDNNKSSKHKIKLNPLSEANFNDYKNRKKIYLHFVIDEEENSKTNEYNKEIEAYRIKITKLEEKFRNISEEMKKIKNSNILSETNISDIINGVGKEESEVDSFKSEKFKHNNISLKQSFRKMNEENEKTNLYILYLYCSIFDIKQLNYEESDYLEEIKCINNIFQDIPNISANLTFEPLINLINNFKYYFDNVPDIIHININPNYINEELNYNNFGETIKPKLEGLLKELGRLEEISNVKLLILSILPPKKSNEIIDYFKSVKKIIFPSNNLKKQNEIIIFYKEFYQNLILKKYSIDQAFDKSHHNNFKKISSDNEEFYLDIPLSDIKEHIDDEKINNVELNKTCSLKLDFIKFNYHRILGRNIQINNCIEKIKEKVRSLLVYGGVGAGKKSLVQTVGKYFFERNYFKSIQYIEFYDLDDTEEILINKIEEVKNKDTNIYSSNIDVDGISGFSKKILLIIIFNSIINEKSDLRNIEDTINSLKNKYEDIVFLYTCSVESFSIEQKDSNRIKIDKLKPKNVQNLLEYINEEIFDYREKKSNNEFKKLKKSTDYPNYFFLQAIYFKKFGNISHDLLNDFLNKTEKEYKLKHILPLFFILKLGMREDILHLFLEEKEIFIIKNNLNYLIINEAYSEGNNYVIDGYFKKKIQLIIEDRYKNKNNNIKDFYKGYLLEIMKNYALIFRYIVNYSDFPYNLCKEFHAGINQGFWFSLYTSDFKDKYEIFIKNQNQKKIYFDDIRYFYNIKNILENNLYFEIIKENIKEFKEYISQIVI